MSERKTNQKGYIVVTSCKNEEKNIRNLIQSMVEQTIRPRVWVIVDDGSIDDTPNIIKEAKEKYEWIQSIRLNNENEVRDIGLHLSSVMMTAFDFATEYCKKKGIDYAYVGNIDGDMIIEREFFEKLMKEFEKDPELGIAGSGTQYIKGDEIIQPEGNEEEPSGGDMLIRRECFEDCGGIQLSCCWDSVLKAKARLRGWKTKRFEHVKAIETRIPGSEDYWKRGIHTGRSVYQLNLHPLHVMIKFVKILFKRPHYWGIAFISGYLLSLIRREEQIKDEELRNYFWNKWKKYL